MEKSITVLKSSDWEIIYVNGKLDSENHSNRLWPSNILDIIEDSQIGSTNVIYDEDILEQVEKGNITEDELSRDPNNASVIWEYPQELPEELI
jgi:hypothetical protein